MSARAPSAAAALGPEVDHLARALDAERPERRVVLAACTARPRSGRPASPASGSRTSARRRARAPRGRRGRTGSRPPEGSAGPGASRRRTCGRPVSASVRRSPSFATSRRAKSRSRRRPLAVAPPRVRADGDHEPPDLLADRRARLRRRGRSRRRTTSTSSSPAIRLRPRTPHFVWSATTTSPLGGGDERAVGLGLEQVRRRQTRVRR